MHIPDGYLSTETAIAAYAVAAPIWLRATTKVKKLLVGRTVPLVALFSAFSFIIMMFNVPLPGGTTGHAIGTTLAAIVLGPWAAVLTVSIALIIQALFFGDGGILSLGANILNMAIIAGFSGYTLYRLLSSDAPLSSPRRAIAAAIASYIGINLAAFATGMELGIQPILFHDAAGHALYFPYPLDVALPSMMLGHLTIAGLVEAVATGLVVAWLQRAEPQLLQTFAGATATTGRALKWGWAAIVALMILTPLGLLAPGTAWGEWGREELQSLGLGYIPAGFDRFADIWAAPLSGYDLPILANPTVGYIVSALVGVALILAALFALGWVLDRILRRTETPAAMSK